MDPIDVLKEANRDNEAKQRMIEMSRARKEARKKNQSLLLVSRVNIPELRKNEVPFTRIYDTDYTALVTSNLIEFEDLGKAISLRVR